MRKCSRGFAVFVSLSTLLGACGEPPSPVAPAATTPPPADSPALAAASPSTASAAADASAGAEPADAGSAAPTAATPGAGGVVAEGHDECAMIAAPFEEKVRAKFNECYQAGKKKNPELAGTIKVTLKVDTKGKVTKVVADKSQLDAPVVDCMLKAVKKEPFDAKKCLGKDVAVSKTFGAR